MKFQGIPALAVAAGMALLAATPGLGDGTTTNAKKPPTDTKKTVTVVKPAIDSGKSSKDKDRQIPKTMPPKTITTSPVTSKPKTDVKPMVKPAPAATVKTAPVAKPMPAAKPMPVSKPVVNVKPAPKTIPIVNAKPATIAKPMPVVKPAPVVKPMPVAKSLEKKPVVSKPAPVVKSQPVKPQPIVTPKTPVKPVVTAKVAPSTPKSTVKSNGKVMTAAKPVTKPQSAPVTKVASNGKSMPNAKPVGFVKQATRFTATPNKMQASAAKSIAAKPMATKAVETKSTMTKPVATAPVKTTSTKPVQKQPVVAPKLPVGNDKINMTKEQREKATVIAQKYDVQIQNLQKQLADMQASREKELSALLKPQTTQLAKAKTDSQPKMSSPKVETKRTIAPTDKVKTAPAPKGNTTKRDAKPAAPIAKDKVVKKA
jgi:hypothetical protein